MRVWHIAALVAAGLITGEIWRGDLTAPFQHATLDVFLPALIFEGAWQLDPRTMFARRRAIALLILPGVALTAALVAAATHIFAGLALAAALLLGAIVSATDPVAVVAIFKRMRVPHDLATIVESESLLNDAIAVVLYRAALAAALATGSFGMPHLVGTAILGVALGVLVGLAFGFVAAVVARKELGAFVQSVVSFAAAYAAYYVCARMGWSGIFAVIACAMILREADRRAHAGRIAVMIDRVWGGAATAANAVLFFLIGAAVEAGHIVNEPALVVAAVLATLAARTVMAYGLLAFAPKLARAWKSIIQLAGVRGALSLALALALPLSLPGRQPIIDATFAIVIATIVLTTLTIEPQLKRSQLS
jgi:CPA1 family monovalent cation:H+ antiporter